MLQKFSNSPRKLTGGHYTPEAFAHFVADQIAGIYSGPATPRIIDPSAGDGELLVAMLKRLRGKALAFGYDTDAQAISVARGRIADAFPKCSAHLEHCDFLSVALASRDGGLFSKPESFDLAIANPPYVRTQVMGATRAQELAQQFNLVGRVDLYFAFIEGIAEVLCPGGIAGVIVSNRFMTTRSGELVRQRLLERFDVLHVWDLGDTRLFEAAVLPAVLLLRKKDGSPVQPARFSSVYSSREPTQAEAVDIFEALKIDGVISTPSGNFHVRHGLLDHGPHPSGVWKIATPSSDEWLTTVRAHTFCTFGDIGKIRVGVKSTADKVFVRSDWGESSERPELLRPLINHHVARRYKSLPPNREILYTHVAKGGKKVAVDLKKFPRSKKFLESHRATLEARSYVIEAGRKWFELWVPQNPASWGLPKLVFPDISEKPVFWMSLENEVINGDCYWIAGETEEQTELLWLALAVANSSFAEEFYDHEFHNKLYAGRRRFMTQYVEKFPLPDSTTLIAKEIVRDAKLLHKTMPNPKAAEIEKRLEQKVRSAFGLLAEKVPRERNLELCV